MKVHLLRPANNHKGELESVSPAPGEPRCREPKPAAYDNLMRDPEPETLSKLTQILDIINVCCFKLLSLGVIYYAAIDS